MTITKEKKARACVDKNEEQRRKSHAVSVNVNWYGLYETSMELPQQIKNKIII